MSDKRRYIPVHSGMPAAASLTDPLKLTSVPAVEAYLANTPFAGQSVTYLTGGTINYLYRIHLLAPIEGCRTVVLKHAQPFMKDEGIACDPERQIFEVEVITRVRSILDPASLVHIPKVYHFDASNSVIIMEDCGFDVVTLEDFLCSGDASAPGVAESIGTALGEFISLLHEWSRSNPDGVLDAFDKNIQGKMATAEFYYDRLVATLQKSDKDDLPLLSGLETDSSDIQVISAFTDEYRSHMMSPRVPGRDVLLMGDFWHANVVVSARQEPLRLFVLDWELARTGLPGFEIGLFCAAMVFLVRKYPVASEPGSLILRNFIDAYRRVSNRDANLVQDVLSHWGGYHIFWAPRDPLFSDSDKELVQDFVRNGVKFMVRSRDKDFQVQSPANSLLLK